MKTEITAALITAMLIITPILLFIVNHLLLVWFLLIILVSGIVGLVYIMVLTILEFW